MFILTVAYVDVSNYHLLSALLNASPLSTMSCSSLNFESLVHSHNDVCLLILQLFKSCVDNLLSLFSLVTTAKLSKFHPSIYVYAYMSYIYIYELHPVSFTPMKYWCSLTNNLHSPWVSVVSESTWPVIHLLSSVNLLPKNSSSYMINHCWICLQNVNRLHRPLVGFGWLFQKAFSLKWFCLRNFVNN